MEPNDPALPRRSGPGPADGPCYRRAFSTLGCPDADLGGVLELAVRHGVRAVELRALGGSVDLPSHFAANPDALGRITGEFRSHGVSITALDTSLQLMDAGESDFEEFLGFAPWAEAMGVPWLRVFDGGKTASGVELAHAASIVGRWAQVRRERRWNVDIMVETHDALSNSGAIERFARAFPGIGVLWDSHCTWSIGGEDPASTWGAIGAHVVHIHVKDSRRALGRGGHTDYSLPGQGDYPMRELLSAISGKYSGCLSLEWEKKWHPELPSLEEALESAHASSWW